MPPSPPNYNSTAYADMVNAPTDHPTDPQSHALDLHRSGQSVTYAIDGDTTSYLVVLPDGSEWIITEWALGQTTIDPAYICQTN